LAFHRAIGVDRKIARLRQLRDRWAKRLLAASDRVRMLTPIGPNESGAIGVVAVEGMDIGKLQAWLLTKHHIVATPLIHPEFSGLRVTPNVYTTLDEVDLFADRMEQAIRRGVA
jgi:selenocysteine lyase/cysteine desulfurase